MYSPADLPSSTRAAPAKKRIWSHIGGTSSSMRQLLRLAGVLRLDLDELARRAPRSRRRSAAARAGARSAWCRASSSNARAASWNAASMSASPRQRRRSRTTSPVLGSIRSVVAPVGGGDPLAVDEVADLDGHRSSSRVAVAGARRHVERRVAVEEADRLEPERDGVDRHHRPLLRARDVVDAEHVPEHDVGVLDRAVLRGPRRQPAVAARSGRRTRRTASARPRRTA